MKMISLYIPWKTEFFKNFSTLYLAVSLEQRWKNIKK
jgi:hypothetical protein